jgi:homoserine O-acetyltransferase
LILILALACSSAVADSPQQMASIGDLELSSGETLLDARVGFRTAGTLNADKSNVVVFLTWFTGTTGSLIKWEKIGPGKLADSDRYYVIAIDALGNGVSSSPSNSPQQPGKQFPRISIADMVNSQHALLTQHLGISRAYAVMGISMGGMQTFRWIGQHPGFMKKAIAIDGSPAPTSYDLLQWQTHEKAITMMQQAGIENTDIMNFTSTLSLLTLWTPGYFVEKITPDELPKFIADSSQGSGEGNANDYLVQLRAMISHNVYATDAPDETPYLERVRADLLVIGTNDDHMVNQTPGKILSRSLNEDHVALESNCGHLGSGCEGAQVLQAVHSFLQK